VERLDEVKQGIKKREGGMRYSVVNTRKESTVHTRPTKQRMITTKLDV